MSIGAKTSRGDKRNDTFALSGIQGAQDILLRALISGFLGQKNSIPSTARFFTPPSGGGGGGGISSESQPRKLK